MWLHPTAHEEQTKEVPAKAKDLSLFSVLSVILNRSCS